MSPDTPQFQAPGTVPSSASSTSLKWGRDGELSPVDLQRVLERLTDPSLIQCPLDPEG
jgi:hypothetical protein